MGLDHEQMWPFFCLMHTDGMGTFPVAGIMIGATHQETAEFWANLMNCDRTFHIPLFDQGPIPVQNLPAQIHLNGVSLLLDIGVACVSPHHSGMHSLFALLKYPGLISAQIGFLFRPSTSQIDIHKKKVISDEFGCGMAFAISRLIFGKTHFLDFQTGMDLGLVATTAPQSRQPDYLAWGAALPNEMMLLEAKGTQTSLNYGISQIADACDQLQAATVLANGYTQTRVAVATALMRVGAPNPSTIFVGDPDAREPYKYEIQGDARRAIQISHYSRVSKLIGDYELSGRLTGQKDLSDTERARRTVLGTEAVGTTLRLGSAKRYVEMFIGITEGIRKGLLSGHLVEPNRAMTTDQVESDGTRSIAVVHEDGSCLEFKHLDAI